MKNIAADADAALITRTIIAMAHTLKLRVSAEGEEPEERLAILQALSCDEMKCRTTWSVRRSLLGP